MLRGITKDLTFLVSEVRSIPIIESFWEEYPIYYEFPSDAYIVLKGKIIEVKRGNTLAWDKNGKMHFFNGTEWQNKYGKFLKGQRENEKKS